MKIKLENWSVITAADPYMAPEMMSLHLQGNVFNDSRREDNTNVVTSKVIGQRNGRVVTNSGSEYELGGVDPNYELLFPNAKLRCFTSLPPV